MGLMLCGKGCELLTSNQRAKELFARAGILNGESTCHKLLLNEDTPCEDCPATLSDGETKHHSMSFRGSDGDVYLKVYCRGWEGHHLLTLIDVSREISMLRQTDLDRKELQAKNILLERRRRKNDEEQKFLGQLMDQLPDALLTVDETFLIQRKNRVASEILRAEGDGHCYSMFGRETPCEGCPAQRGFALVDGEKKSHEHDGRYFTEIFSVSPNGKGGMLIFREITRQILLIGQIREHQATIAQKNEFLSGLVEFGTYLQKESDVCHAVCSFFDKFLGLLNCKAAAIIVNDTRAGNLWLTEQYGVEAEVMNEFSKACLSREMLSSDAQLLPNDILPWEQSTQVVLRGANGQKVGIAVFEGEFDGQGHDFLQLVTEPLGSYLQNQLLMRQLEEKANTDALTGLFNRGYLNQALDEEEDKFRQYAIPYAVVLADINQLKMVNDQYGHEVGDSLIVTAAQALQGSLRTTDIAARTGGDEFIILLTNTTDENANHFVERLQKEIFGDLTLALPDEKQFPVTVSLGMAGSDKVTPEELVKEADRLMYATKRKFYESTKRYR